MDMDEYKKAGVDIQAGDRLVHVIKRAAAATYDSGVIGGIGGFSAAYQLKNLELTDPVLVSSTDGVGTKLKIAFLMNKHDTVGIDLVAMCANDILTCGATPLFFLDYLATGRLNEKTASEVITGIAEGCRQAGCALIGGETAEMPDFYADGEYDLAGFIVGMVEKNNIIDGRYIAAGDITLGLPSNGLHSNGFSLVRKVLLKDKNYSLDHQIQELGCTLGEELLKPTRIYQKHIQLLLSSKIRLKGIAHITGGGITGNLPRILPMETAARIEANSWPVPPIFQILQTEGNISQSEMYSVFNMGIGMIIVLAEASVEGAINILKSKGDIEPMVIGKIIEGKRKVYYV